MMPNHIATRCGVPSAPMVAMVIERLWSRNAATSSSDMVIWLRWLMPMR